MTPDAPRELHRQLDACIRGLRSEMIDFTKELVAVPSANPPGDRYPECVRLIASRLRALGLPCERVPFRARSDPRDESGAAVVLSSVGSGTRTLYFSGHYDVVPVTTPGQSTPVLRGKALFARGSADMKGGLAAMLYAAVALQRLRVPLDGRVALVFVPDEETGGRRGSGFLAASKRLGAQGIGMLTPEPTSGAVWNANRGALTVRVTVHGREAAHVRAITGRTPKFEMCPGLLEIRFYAAQGMPAYAYGPGLLSVAHGPREFVHTARIVECAAIYARTAATVLA